MNQLAYETIPGFSAITYIEGGALPSEPMITDFTAPETPMHDCHRPFADDFRLPEAPDALAARRRLDVAFARLETLLEARLDATAGPPTPLRVDQPSGGLAELDPDPTFPTLWIFPAATPERPGLRVWRAPAELLHPDDAALAGRAGLIRRSGVCLPRALPRRPVDPTDVAALRAACRWTTYTLLSSARTWPRRARRAG